MIVQAANAQSYVNIAGHICRVNGWQCDVVRKPSYSFRKADFYVGSQYDVAYDYLFIRGAKPRVIYMTVEGDFANPASWNKLRVICSDAYCVVPTKWGKDIMEEHWVRVAEVVYHALPDPPEPFPTLRNRSRPLDIVYVNAYYQFLDEWGEQIPACERKGWRWWQALRERFSGLGFVNVDKVPGTVTYRVPSESYVYYLMLMGKVYTNLSTHEGFGLNPIMALAVGDKVVAWDIEPFRELLGGISGVYFVPVNYSRFCYASILYGIEPAKFLFQWGDIYTYISTVERALKESVQIDYAEVENRFSPRNYLRFQEFFK
ncbi:MAG: hypothetical protein QXY20_08905 [Thermofilum sp.]|uniref:hypothetical protein n=1 Tax=Thermofilum sp. TaxID=1961369 RepID=UPI003166D66C